MKLLRMLALGALVTSAISLFLRTRQDSSAHQRADRKLDGALDSTFPASDPVATQDFSIPVNRQ